MAKAYLDKLSAYIERVTSGGFDDVMLDCRHFFSGAALYANGNICITLTPVGLALKLSEETRDKLLKNRSVVALRYFPKGPIKKDYVLFPKGVDDGRKGLHQYVQESIVYALTLPKPQRKRR